MAIRAGLKKGTQLNSKLKNLFFITWIELAGRWFLGITFIYACTNKILAPDYFAKIIYGYYLFPDFSINLIAIVLPFLELFSGVALLLGIYPRSAALIVNGMLFAFIIVLSINLIRGQEFDCGCFSFGEPGYTSSLGQLLIRDLIYFFVGLHILFFGEPRRLCILQTGSILKNISRDA